MNKIEKIKNIRNKLKNNQFSIGSWLQLPSPDVAEILANSGYDWINIDSEHGAISIQELPNLFRSIEQGDALPIVRIENQKGFNCSQVLDAGAGGLVIPNITSRDQIENIISMSSYPPTGRRGVGFSRSNLFGINFKKEIDSTIQPLIIAQIEHINAIQNLEDIISVEGLDAVFIGPYDLSSSIGKAGDFESKSFKLALKKFIKICKEKQFPYGIHVVNPSEKELKSKVKQGFQFIGYSTDAYFLHKASVLPKFKSFR